MNADFAKALVAAQKDLPAIEPDAINPHFRSKFVSLDHLLAQALPVLNRHKIGLAQFPTYNDLGAPTLTTILYHESGDSLSHSMPLFLPKQDPQGQGSAITYARRYSLAAALGISSEKDDDGNQAVAAVTAKPAGEDGASRPESETPTGSDAPAGTASPAETTTETPEDKRERWAHAWDERDLGPLRQHIAQTDDLERLRLYRQFEEERKVRTGNSSRKGILTALAEKIHSLEGDGPQAVSQGTDDTLSSSSVSPATPPAGGTASAPAPSPSETLTEPEPLRGEQPSRSDAPETSSVSGSANGTLLSLKACLGFIAEQPASVDKAVSWTVPSVLVQISQSDGGGVFGSLDELPENWVSAVYEAVPGPVREMVAKMGPEALGALAEKAK